MASDPAVLEKGRSITANGLEIYTEQVGHGPDVLLIGGLGDTVESWQFQLEGLADRYRLTAFDNCGAGRTSMRAGPVTVEAMADDAAGVLRALDIRRVHVAGFSGAASSPRSWRSGTPTSSVAWCSRAPGPRQTPTCAPGVGSSDG